MAFCAGSSERVLGNIIATGIERGLWERMDLVVTTKLHMGTQQFQYCENGAVVLRVILVSINWSRACLVKSIVFFGAHVKTSLIECCVLYLRCSLPACLRRALRCAVTVTECRRSWPEGLDQLHMNIIYK